MLKRVLQVLVAGCAIIIVGFNLWGAVTLGVLTPDPDAYLDPAANRVVMVFGASGSVGDGLLKAAMEDPDVEEIYALTRRLSPRLERGQVSGRVKVMLHNDFTDYSELDDTLARVNTVMWGLGASSIGMDAELYRRIHVDFPIAFVEAWLDQPSDAPRAFHYVTGMGTGEQESAQWAKDKGGAERRVAEMAQGTSLRTFGHRSAWVRPTAENAGPGIYLGELLLKPGHLVIRGIDLGRAMLEISARTGELPNGTLIDNKDALDYAAAYRVRHQLD
ncbi:hypothetical protein C0039_00740 [Pseudohalioglobus lutimaris]|uniref:Uncharacterized protein n=2 Tax=Pseudohalioglobus lutimaris TaxID=1737061 RepID=A0A2N5X953_9GAMM|nr:hypothetical protein C0039_00740 [Pseudohalioglobus lutimaris]